MLQMAVMAPVPSTAELAALSLTSSSPRAGPVPPITGHRAWSTEYVKTAFLYVPIYTAPNSDCPELHGTFRETVTIGMMQPSPSYTTIADVKIARCRSVRCSDLLFAPGSDSQAGS